jgi:beta-glucanase (GH16 family)
MISSLRLLTLLLAVFFLGCSKSNDTASLPEVTPYGVTETRNVTDTDFEFKFKFNVAKASTSDITIDYTTKDGSALAGTDYVAASGTATIPAGSLSGIVKVKVKADSLRKANQTFSLILSNPKNCTLTSTSTVGTIVNTDGLYLPVDNTGYSTPATYPSYTLIWSDEFNGKTIDDNAWSFELGNSGWGNHELENYTNRTQNAFVSKGNLIIEARQENYSGSNYTSARMITKGKKTFKYGRVDIRAKVPTGQGIWPALWMLGQNIDQAGWPTCGEIDIMELVGNTPNKVYGTLHWGPSVAGHQSYGTNYLLSSGIFNDQFHVFSLIWDASQVQILVDDNVYFTMTNNNTLPFSSDFFFIFNVAVGGDWPGSPNSNTSFPQRMVVDYVRVFQ